ncbi:hypothetical protein [Acetobacter sp. LMG 32666]|uniref:hypothetical protein n=1 Tax=Acetobacter sp. LMG 32666 TaxID=2959295 RepID=UPI0030C8B1C1
MRGNVMTLQPENSSVTMLRTNTKENPSPDSPQGKSQAEDTNSTPPSSREDGGPELSSSKQTDTDAVKSASTFNLARLKNPACLLVASAAAIFIGTKATGIQLPFLGQNSTKAVVAIQPVQRNMSDITPPDMALTPVPPAAQKTLLPPPAPHIETVQAQSKTPLQPLLVPPSPAMADAAALVAPSEADHVATGKTTPDVHAVSDTHFENRMDTATALNHPNDVQPQNQDSASDRLFIEMHRQLTDMSNQMKELQAKLDTTQQALNDRISTGLGKIDGRLDELQHREDLIESQKRPEPTSSSQGTTPKAAPTDTRANPVSTALSDHHTVKKITKDPTPAPLPHYSVQAGAPDIAILMDSSGTPLRVQPGSNIDGWGNVLAVMPAGNGWVVKTEHGIIR